MATSFEPIFPDAVSSQAGPSWLSAVQSRSGFSEDSRFGGTPSDDAADQSDPALEQALADAFANGEKHGRDAAAAESAELASAQSKLALSINRLETDLQEKLANRLAETVAALCEDTLAPLALERDALERRCIDASRLLGDSLMDSTLSMHPDDIELLGRDFSATWHMLPNAELERGTVSFDTPEGAVIDGPAEWRAALREALGLC